MRFDTLYLRFLQAIPGGIVYSDGRRIRRLHIGQARAIYETIEQQREAERQELADKQQAEKDALEAAQRAEREQAARDKAEYNRRYLAAGCTSANATIYFALGYTNQAVTITNAPIKPDTLAPSERLKQMPRAVRGCDSGKG